MALAACICAAASATVKYSLYINYTDWETSFYESVQQAGQSEWPLSGEGTSADPYRINSERDLAAVAYHVNVNHNSFYGKYFRLERDLNLIGLSCTWIPIGVDDTPFEGYFDGNNHTIANMQMHVVNSPEWHGYNYGLFGKCTGAIRNLKMTGASVTIGQTDNNNSYQLNIGLLCGHLSYNYSKVLYGAIYGCNVRGEMRGTVSQQADCSSLGGLVGLAQNPVCIYRCHTEFTTYLNGAFDVGGIVGCVSPYTIDIARFGHAKESFVFDCTADVNITVNRTTIDYFHAGGICGTSGGNIEACASSGSVTVNTDGTAAGICGRNKGNIIACVSTVTATGGYNVGGIVGKNESNSVGEKELPGQIHNCVFSGHLYGADATYCGGIAARSPGERVCNSLFLGTVEPSTVSNYSTPIQQRTNGEANSKEPVNCYYDRSLCQLVNSNAVKTFSELTGNGDELTLSAEEDVLYTNEAIYYNNMSVSVRGVTWAYAAGFYPRLCVDGINNASYTGEYMKESVLPRAMTNWGDETDLYTPALFPAYASLAAIPPGFTESNRAHYLDNAFSLAPKTCNEKTYSYGLSNEALFGIEGQTATPRDPGTSMLRVTTAEGPSKQFLLRVTCGKTWDGNFADGYDGGNGSQETPYLIHNARQLMKAFRDNVAGDYYALTQDIWFNEDLLDATGEVKEGKRAWDHRSFTANWSARLDGRGHLVRGIYATNACGIFYHVKEGAVIENVGFVNTYTRRSADDRDHANALLAEQIEANATVSNCIFEGSVVAGSNHAFWAYALAHRIDGTVKDCIIAVNGVDGNIRNLCRRVSSSQNVVRCLMLPNNVVTLKPEDEGYEPIDFYVPEGTVSQVNAENVKTVSALISGEALSGEQWITATRRLPALKTFAETDYGRLLSLPLYSSSANPLYDLKTQMEFEPGAASWSLNTDSYLEIYPEMGIIAPKGAGTCFMTRRLDDAKVITPLTVSASCKPGVTFTDDNTKTFCVNHFDSDANGYLTLSELAAVSNSSLSTAMNYASATTQIGQFPEFRLFNSVDDFGASFREKTNITELQLPQNVTALGGDAFKGCTGLTAISLPAKVSTVGEHPFYASAVTNIYVDPDNGCFASRDGVLMTKEGNQLVCYPGGRTGDITLHGRVECINSNAIYKIDGATSLYLNAPDHDSYTELAADGITSANGELMTVYVKDATNDLTEDQRQEAETGEGRGVLLEQFKDAACWSAYREAGKLKRYFDLEVSANSRDNEGNYWATMYIGFDTTLPDGLTAYIVDKDKTSENEEYLVLREISGRVPMLTPVVIRATASGTYKLYPSEARKFAERNMSENLLNGIGRNGLDVNQSDAIEGGCLTLGRNKKGEVGFFIYRGTKKISAYRAYLTVNRVNGARLICLPDDPTAISATKASDVNSGDTWYTLDGRKLSRRPSERGIYVHNGQKIFIK